MKDERQIGSARQGGCEKEQIGVSALLIDFHNTMVLIEPGAVKKAAEQALGCEIKETDGQIAERIECARLFCEELSEVTGKTPDWTTVNTVAFADLRCTPEQAMEMSRLITAAGNYAPNKERIEFVRWMLGKFPSRNHEGKFVMTASNAQHSQVASFLHENDLQAISPITGQTLSVYKPDPAFFVRISELTTVPAVNTLVVGNSWRNDAVASFLGMHVVVILPQSVKLTDKEIMRRIRKVRRPKGKIFLVRTVDEAKAIIDVNFVSA